MDAPTASLVLLLAVMLDAALGEPPTRLHPVAWMGGYLGWAKRKRSRTGWLAFWQGLALLGLGMTIVGSASYAATRLLGLLPAGLELLLAALVLKPMFSLRALLEAGGAVRTALERHEPARARALLARHLVSRPTEDLSDAEVAGAAAESLAENLTDSVIAPLLYFALFGLPGAALYRFVNTADAVLGYRTPELGHYGKSAARLDDALNWVPARTAALLLLFATWLHRQDARSAWRTLRRDARVTPSPNAGWTMATLAGGLGVRLDKRGTYVLNPTGRPPAARDIALSQRLVLTASGLGVLAALGVAHA